MIGECLLDTAGISFRRVVIYGNASVMNVQRRVYATTLNAVKFNWKCNFLLGCAGDIVDVTGRVFQKQTTSIVR